MVSDKTDVPYKRGSQVRTQLRPPNQMWLSVGLSRGRSTFKFGHNAKVLASLFSWATRSEDRPFQMIIN